MINVAWSEPCPAMKLNPCNCSRLRIAGLLASIASIWSITSCVRTALVAGGIDTVQNNVPVSSLGTNPVLVVFIVRNRAMAPTKTNTPVRIGFLTSFSTLFLYLPKTLS